MGGVHKGHATGMAAVGAMMDQGIRQGVFPGGVLLASRGNVIRYHDARGVCHLSHGPPVTRDTCFDLASLTKPLATALCAAQLVDQGRLDPDAPLGRILDCTGHPDKGVITVDQLLRHQSGLPAHRPYFRQLAGLSRRQVREVLWHCLMAEPLVYAPGTCQEYSDLGYMVLGRIIESITGTSLDRLARRTLFAPLGVDLFFRPLQGGRAGEDGASRRFAATECCPWRKKVLQGEVHDDNAWTMGGVAGHAGLFGTAHAVWRLLVRVMAALTGRDTAGVIPAGVVQRFVRRSGPGEMVAGFDTPTPGSSSAGRYFSDRALGHLGFTGTSFWMDPSCNVIVVLLTNRVHPCRDNPAIRNFRPQLHDTVMEMLFSVQGSP